MSSFEVISLSLSKCTENDTLFDKSRKSFSCCNRTPINITTTRLHFVNKTVMRKKLSINSINVARQNVKRIRKCSNLLNIYAVCEYLFAFFFTGVNSRPIKELYTQLKEGKEKSKTTNSKKSKIINKLKISQFQINFKWQIPLKML